MGLFDRQKQQANHGTANRTTTSDSAPRAGQPGVVVVHCTDGPVAETRRQVEDFQQQGLPQVTAILEIGPVTEPELIALVEMETWELFESCGFTPSQVTLVRQ